MKKYLNITGEILLGLLLVGIVFTASMAVLSLTPGNAENKNNVLGESTNNIDIPVIYNEIYKEYEFFKVVTKRKEGFNQKITLGPVAKAEINQPILSVTNDSSKLGNFKISLLVPDEFTKYADFGIVYKGETILLVSNGFENYFTGTISPYTTHEINLFVKAFQNINFPITFEIKAD